MKIHHLTVSDAFASLKSGSAGLDAEHEARDGSLTTNLLRQNLIEGRSNANVGWIQAHGAARQHVRAASQVGAGRRYCLLIEESTCARGNIGQG